MCTRWVRYYIGKVYDLVLQTLTYLEYLPSLCPKNGKFEVVGGRAIWVSTGVVTRYAILDRYDT